MSETAVKTAITDHVGEIVLNRPHRHNAMTDEAQEQLLEAVNFFATDARVRALVLRGEGKSFCSGRDVSVLGSRKDGESDYDFVRRAQRIQHALLDCSKPIVASIKGAAIGGGFEFALAADMRVVSPSAKMSLPEIRYGLLPDMGGTQTLMSMIGRSKTKYLVMTGTAINGEQALQWGIADWLVGDDKVDAKALEIAAEIAANPPVHLAMAKGLIDQFWCEGIKRGLDKELLSITGLFKSEDYHEARQAMKEDRKPVYNGR